MVAIAFIRRILGIGPARGEGEPAHGATEPAPGTEPARPPEPEPAPPPEPAPVPEIACPNCGAILCPPPSHTRLCPRCRHRIVVRRLRGRVVYLAEAAVATFKAERDRETLERSRAVQRDRWLELARRVGANEERCRALAGAQPTSAVVAASRALYVSGADQAVRAARREKRWAEVAQVRRQQAGALFAEAGGIPPPGDAVVELFREGVTATLRAQAFVSGEAELIGGTCCATCRADNGRVFRVADELRTPRLPHSGCPRGLCACDWWPALRTPPPRRTGRRRAAMPPVPAGAAVEVEVPDPGVRSREGGAGDTTAEAAAAGDADAGAEDERGERDDDAGPRAAAPDGGG